MTASNSNGWVHTVSELIKTWIQPIFEIVIYLRVPLTIALVASLIFTKVDQTIEVYRAIAADSNKVYEASVTVCAVSLLTIFVWYVSRFLVLEQGNRFQNNLADWTPRILGIVPILSLVLGILKAWNESINDSGTILFDDLDDFKPKHWDYYFLPTLETHRLISSMLFGV
jgi:hypothetical protein